MWKITSLCILLLLLSAACAAADEFCFDEAGAQYSINPQILRAIAKVESNFNPRAINWNTNGSYDFGMMQINSIWAPTLGKERWNSLGDTCTNIKTGAMILANCMKKYGYTWEAIGCYNSQTPGKRDRYARTVFKQLQRIQRDDKELKANLEATVRDRVNGLVQASQNGGPIELRLDIQPATPANSKVPGGNSPSSVQEQSAATPNVPAVELRASSLFEGAASGM
jgi:hypothetical protein